MPRRPRTFLPNVPVHIVQRGASREAVFFDDEDYKAYAGWMKEAGLVYDVAIHAFVLMTNHIHILISAQAPENVGKFMQHIGRRYVPFINHKYGRSGSLREGRYKSNLVQSERYFLAVMRYIELNPVRASMVEQAAQYRWSSFRHNCGLKPLSFITPHTTFDSLGSDIETRSRSYLSMFEHQQNSQEINTIRNAWQRGRPLA